MPNYIQTTRSKRFKTITLLNKNILFWNFLFTPGNYGASLGKKACSTSFERSY